MAPKWLVPAIFITIQTTLELMIYFSHIRRLILTGTKKVRFFSICWVLQYFYSLWTFSAASFMDPGYLPNTWLSEVQNDPEYKEEPEENGEKNFCEICCFPRPLRCHHCRECGKCVLLYDHHCFFISNCVGFRNYRSFFLFLTIFPIHTIHFIFLVMYNMVQVDNPSPMQMVSMLLGILYFFMFSLFVVSQLANQVVFLVQNRTWVEESMRKAQRALYEKAGVKQVNIYDVGLLENMKCRLGQNPLLWLLPIPNYDNPYKYKINPEWVPVYKLKVPLFDGFDENSPLLERYTRKRAAVLNDRV